MIMAGLVGIIILCKLNDWRKRKVIKAPVLGLLNLGGAAQQEHLRTDLGTFGHLFKSAEESDFFPPTCDVLFLYAPIQTDGSIDGSSKRIGEIITQSGASVIVIANNHEEGTYHSILRETGFPDATVIMTLGRDGDCFPRFFEKLFSRMMKGKSLIENWSKLAPQNRKAKHTGVPHTFGRMGKKTVSFK